MPLLRVEAEKLSNNDLVRGVVEEIIDRDPLYALLPFAQTTGKAYVYNRENTISEGDFLDPNEVINEGGATFDEITTKLRILAGDVDVDNFLRETMGDTNDQLGIQIAEKAKGMARKFRRTLITGDATGNPKEFDGIGNLVVAGQSISAGTNGAAVSLSMIDELLDAVKNGADALIMRHGTWRAVKALMRAAGGTTPPMLQWENFGVPVPAYDGVPVILSDFVPGDVDQGTATDTCSIYAVRLNEVDGLHGIFGGPSAGLRLEEVGLVQNKDAYRYRMKWYTGLALKSTQSLARVVGVTNI